MKSVVYPVFQAVIDLTTKRFCWVEALVRLAGDTSEKGHIPLIRIAERYQFIHHLDSAMTEIAFDLLHVVGMPIAVNVSAVTIERNPVSILGILRFNREVAKNIIIEITETAQIHDYQAVMRFVCEARMLGTKIAIDDFGSGFFTLDSVGMITPDIIKLSGGLISQVHATKNYALLDDIRAIATATDADLLAEGIDSWGKYELAKHIGCRYAQGYTIAKPIPIASLCTYPLAGTLAVIG